MFRRAAELETAGIRGDSAAMLDADTLEAIGREVGLSPAVIHAALAEFQSGGLRVADRDFDIVSSRVVPGPASDVRLSVDELANGNLLAMRQSRGETTAWTRQGGVGRAVLRRLGGRARYPLGAVGELRATVTDHAAAPGSGAPAPGGAARVPVAVPSRAHAGPARCGRRRRGGRVRLGATAPRRHLRVVRRDRRHPALGLRDRCADVSQSRRLRRRCAPALPRPSGARSARLDPRVARFCALTRRRPGRSRRRACYAAVRLPRSRAGCLRRRGRG